MRQPEFETPCGTSKTLGFGNPLRMSASGSLRRVVSGSAANWCRIGVTIFCQLALVPVYLSHWSAEVYGIWLAVTALMGLIQIISNGYQGFLQNEFLRIGVARIRFLRRVLWSASAIAVLFGLLELGAAVLLARSSWLVSLVGAETVSGQLAREISIVVVLNALVWFLCGTFGGLAVRILSAFGYFAVLAWWGVFMSLAIAIAPAVVVAFGGSFLAAGQAMAAITVLVNIPLFIFMIKCLQRHDLFPIQIDLALGLRHLGRSQLVTARTFLDMLRQQGVRIVMAPLAGAAELAAFSTTRTGANLALQAVGTITQPLMPELMRFLNARDQARSTGAFGAVWFALLVAMIPGALLMQRFIPPLFEIWTKGKITFDPILFALLTMTVLVYALCQPAQAVVIGNNLLRSQLVVAILSGIVGIGGMFLLIPHYGTQGAAFALLVAEVIASGAYIAIAASWLKRQGLRWPWREFAYVASAVISCVPALWFIIDLANTRIANLPIVIGLAASFTATFCYWKLLPDFIQQRVRNLVLSRINPLYRG